MALDEEGVDPQTCVDVVKSPEVQQVMQDLDRSPKDSRQPRRTHRRQAPQRESVTDEDMASVSSTISEIREQGRLREGRSEEKGSVPLPTRKRSSSLPRLPDRIGERSKRAIQGIITEGYDARERALSGKAKETAPIGYFGIDPETAYVSQTFDTQGGLSDQSKAGIAYTLDTLSGVNRGLDLVTFEHGVGRARRLIRGSISFRQGLAEGSGT